MFCRKCGTELDTTKRLENGTVRCSGCGALYRPKGSSSASDSQSIAPDRETDTVESTTATNNDDYKRIKRQATERINRAKSAAEKTGKRLAAQAREVDYEGIRNRAYKGTQTAKNVVTGFIGDFLNLKVGKYPAWIALIAVVIIIVLSVSIFGGGKYSAQYELLSRMEKAYNKKDMNALMSCFDPNVTQSLMSLAGLVGINADTIESMIPFGNLIASQVGVSISDNWGKVKIKGLSCSVNGSSGTIRYRITWTGAGKTTSVEDTEKIIKVGNKWYFGISLF